VQQVTYDDTGEYNLVLLNTPPGTPQYFVPKFTDGTLTDEEIKSWSEELFEGREWTASLYLTDFKIEYVHAVTETQQTVPNKETVVVLGE